ncbi:MAG: hypothetical protein ACP5QT_03315 [Brevinematia bacterium]
MYDNVMIAKNNFYNSFETEEFKKEVSNIGESLVEIKSNVDKTLVDLGVNTNNNTLSMTAMLSNSGLTNVDLNQVPDLTLFYLTNSGITNYSQLTNLLAENGFTNQSGTADVSTFVDNFTNVFSDTTSVANNLYDTLTNYYK